MPLRVCDSETCGQPAERTFGSCQICSSNYCLKHGERPFHTCPDIDHETDAYYAALDDAQRQRVTAFLSGVNAQALIALASSLRNNKICSIPALTGSDSDLAWSQLGGQNLHVDVKFEDGVTWLARLRMHNALMFPISIQPYITSSDCATLKFLETAGMKTPRVHHVVPSVKNDIGSAYALIDKIDGKPLDWPWASPTQKTKVMEQLVDVFLQLEKHPFGDTGSLIENNGLIRVGAFAQTQLFESPQSPLGPFSSFEMSLKSVIAQQMRLIENGEFSPLPVDHYLSFLWRQEMVPRLLSEHMVDLFYLHHFEDRGDHIMVDDEHNITGIIDWEFASTEVKQLAFASPCMMWNVRAFHEGSNDLAPEELEFAHLFELRGRIDMANIVRHGKKWQRFFFFNGGTVATTPERFESMFQGLRRAWARDDEHIESYEAWRKNAIDKYGKTDTVLQSLLKRERYGIA